jgi:protein TonB
LRERRLCVIRAPLCGVHTSKQVSHAEDTMVAQGTIKPGLVEQKMFADSLIETSWAQRSRRSWTTLTSFGLEALALGLLLLLPLWKTIGPPAVRAVSTPISLGQPMPLAPRPVAHSGSGSSNAPTIDISNPRLMQPRHIPTTISPGTDDPVPQPTIGTGIGPGGPPGQGFPGGLLPAGDGTMPLPLRPPTPAAHTFRTSRILEGSILRRVQPVYPPLARSARIQGSVILAAVISKSGAIENLRLLSGHPMLVPAAIDAVSQWRYRPYILNNEPVEVETQITVNFTLGGN